MATMVGPHTCGWRVDTIRRKGGISGDARRGAREIWGDAREIWGGVKMDGRCDGWCVLGTLPHDCLLKQRLQSMLGQQD